MCLVAWKRCCKHVCTCVCACVCECTCVYAHVIVQLPCLAQGLSRVKVIANPCGQSGAQVACTAEGCKQASCRCLVQPAMCDQADFGGCTRDRASGGKNAGRACTQAGVLHPPRWGQADAPHGTEVWEGVCTLVPALGARARSASS